MLSWGDRNRGTFGISFLVCNPKSNKYLQFCVLNLGCSTTLNQFATSNWPVCWYRKQLYFLLCTITRLWSLERPAQPPQLPIVCILETSTTYCVTAVSNKSKNTFFSLAMFSLACFYGQRLYERTFMHILMIICCGI